MIHRQLVVPVAIADAAGDPIEDAEAAEVTVEAEGPDGQPLEPRGQRGAVETSLASDIVDHELDHRHSCAFFRANLAYVET